MNKKHRFEELNTGWMLQLLADLGTSLPRPAIQFARIATMSKEEISNSMKEFLEKKKETQAQEQNGITNTNTNNNENVNDTENENAVTTTDKSNQNTKNNKNNKNKNKKQKNNSPKNKNKNKNKGKNKQEQTKDGTNREVVRREVDVHAAKEIVSFENERLTWQMILNQVAVQKAFYQQKSMKCADSFCKVCSFLFVCLFVNKSVTLCMCMGNFVGTFNR